LNNLATALLLGIIGLSIRKIIHVENNIDKIRKEKDETLKNFLDYVGEKYNIEILDSQKTLDEFENKATKKEKKQIDEKNKKTDDDEVL